MRAIKRISLPVLVSIYLLSLALGLQTKVSNAVWLEENRLTTQGTTDLGVSSVNDADQAVATSSQENLTITFQGGHQLQQLSAASKSASFSRHMMCKGHDLYFNPVNATTIFRPTDTKAECLTTVTISSKIEFRWSYRNDSSKDWVSCYNWSTNALIPTEYYYAGYLLISGYWPGLNFPRAYKVEVYLDDIFSFSDFFEVTNGGLNSPRTSENVDASGRPVNTKSRFTVGIDTRAYHCLRFDKIAYFNEELGYCHNFTTVWIQPNGTTYKAHSSSFDDYKDNDTSWNCWNYGYIPGDYILIDSNTPIGNWEVEVYIDRYYINNIWMSYGPIAATPFIVGNTTIADWTFMVYLDADNSLETAGIDLFLKMANVNSSPQVNVIVQMDRIPGQDDRFGNWTDCKRFYVTKGMTPTPENAVQNLTEVNMGEPNTLNDFINWAITNYTANYYFLTLWDHGTGCMGVCFDVTDGNDSLSLSDLSQALSGLPMIMDVVLFDACSMAMTEVAYQIRNYANILIGPEGLGYAPGPYDYYLLGLASNSSVLPNVFASNVVAGYVNWCNSLDAIKNATMSATDLTKITNLMAAIDHLALKLNENRSFYNYLINAARNLTQGYEGPLAGLEGYFIDLYHFAQLIHQYVLDEELKNSADQIMTALSIGNTIIAETDKNLPNSHGLAIFFPDAQGKYDSFKSLHEETSFAQDTPWDDFVTHYLHIQEYGHVLTIDTSFSYITIKCDDQPFMTDIQGKLRLLALPGSYVITAQTPVLTDPGSRRIFTGWSDGEHNASRIATVPAPTLTYIAYYENQYQIAFSQSGVGIDYAGTIITIDGSPYNATSLPVSFWWNESPHNFTFQSPLIVAPNAKRYVWTNTSGVLSSQSSLITPSAPGDITGNYRPQCCLSVASDHGSPAPPSGWSDAGESINASVTSPMPGSTGTQYVCTGWTGTGSVNPSGTTTHVFFTLNAPSSITWNWKTQYSLVVRVDPAGLGPQPNVSSLGPWYDSGALITFTAQEISGKLFERWTVDGTDYERGMSRIALTIDRPYEVTAHYVNAPAWWETFSHFETQAILGVVGTGFIVAIASAAWVRNHRRKGLIESYPKPLMTEVPKTTVTLPGRIAAGYEDLDNLLLGGLPENYAIALTSPSCDERGLLITRFLEAGTQKGETTFYITIDPGGAKSLAEEFQSNFYLFICNPRADTMVRSLPNIAKLKGVENLTEITIALTKALRTLDASLGRPKRACIEIISDILLQHHAVQTRRWLTDLIPELRSKGFTTLAVMNPQMHPPEEVQAILELFEGEISIYEKEDLQKVLKIKKMYNQRYMDCELSLRKERLETGNKGKGS